MLGDLLGLAPGGEVRHLAFKTGTSWGGHSEDELDCLTEFCLVGTCQKCIKKVTWDSPSVLNARHVTEGFSEDESVKTLMSVFSKGRAKMSGNSTSECLSGKAKAKMKSTLIHDPAAWLAQRSDKHLCKTC